MLRGVCVWKRGKVGVGKSKGNTCFRNARWRPRLRVARQADASGGEPGMGDGWRSDQRQRTESDCQCTRTGPVQRKTENAHPMSSGRKEERLEGWQGFPAASRPAEPLRLGHAACLAQQMSPPTARTRPNGRASEQQAAQKRNKDPPSRVRSHGHASGPFRRERRFGFDVLASVYAYTSRPQACARVAPLTLARRDRDVPGPMLCEMQRPGYVVRRRRRLRASVLLLLLLPTSARAGRPTISPRPGPDRHPASAHHTLTTMEATLPARILKRPRQSTALDLALGRRKFFKKTAKGKVLKGPSRRRRRHSVPRHPLALLTGRSTPACDIFSRQGALPPQGRHLRL